MSHSQFPLRHEPHYGSRTTQRETTGHKLHTTCNYSEECSFGDYACEVLVTLHTAVSCTQQNRHLPPFSHPHTHLFPSFQGSLASGRPTACYRTKEVLAASPTPPLPFPSPQEGPTVALRTSTPRSPRHPKTQLYPYSNHREAIPAHPSKLAFPSRYESPTHPYAPRRLPHPTRLEILPRNSHLRLLSNDLKMRLIACMRRC